MKQKLPYALVIALAVVLVGCNLPTGRQPTSSSPEAAFTQAAETVAAELTQVSVLNSPTPETMVTDTPTDTLQPSPTDTPIPTATDTPIPCLLVGYNPATIDQTVPDNQVMSPGQTFIKTWRLINAGSCTWNSSYELVFDHGDGMGVSSGYAQTLTSGSVAPGQSVDVSVTLTAPAAPGTYTGYWRFRDPNGIYFGIGGSGTWIVRIKVVNSVTANLTPVPAPESGTIRESAGPFPDYTAGESNVDFTKMVEAYLSYDISGIPSNAAITLVKTDFSHYVVQNNPFSLGALNAYVADYGAALDSADFVPGLPPGNVADWSSTTALNNVEASDELKSALQAKLGSSRFILRIQFGGSNMDAVNDRITFTNPTLIVTYTTP